MADAPPSDPSHQPAPPQLAAANAIAGQPRTPADRSSMRHAHGAETHHARGRCIRRQPALSDAMPLSQSRLVDAFRPSSLVAALLR
jgi:hypothetical protein